MEPGGDESDADAERTFVGGGTGLQETWAGETVPAPREEAYGAEAYVGSGNRALRLCAG